MAVDNARFGSNAEFEVISNDVLQVSGVRNVQMITIKDNLREGSKFLFLNLHLHNPLQKPEYDDYLRAHQASHFLYWMQ